MSASGEPRPFTVHVPDGINASVYDGSLEEWARDPACPMESGPIGR